VATSHFVLGGARSGKSRFAVSNHRDSAHVVFVATAEPGDADMARRIDRHRRERPSPWRTLEEAYALAGVLGRLASERLDAVIVDCVTVWVANRLLRRDAEAEILSEADRIAQLAARPPWDLTLVSNEVGEGVHPETADGLRFRDLLGVVNQKIAAAVDHVTLMVAGLPLTIKTPDRSRDVPAQAP
jgi:adenosylcobinamide kinase/adenosylcobinamide-phosphate guanylyltransferase